MTNDQTTDPLERIRAAMEGLRAAIDEPADDAIYALAEHEHGQATALLATGEWLLGAIEAHGLDCDTGKPRRWWWSPMAHRLAHGYTRQVREVIG
jgi:hypothetical protein